MRDPGLVRSLQPQDLEVVIALDASMLGRRRDEFFKLKLRRAFADTGVAVSLAAELDGVVAGFLLARVYYGEFGLTERTAVMNVIGVRPDFRGRWRSSSEEKMMREGFPQEYGAYAARTKRLIPGIR